MPDRGEPWAIERLEPTTLLALWPRERAPERAEVLAALGRVVGKEVRVIGEEQVDDPGLLWNTVVEVDTWDAPLILWSEAARAGAASELTVPEAEQCIWVIGAQSLLDPACPAEGLAFLLRLLSLAMPEVPAILDQNSTRWYRRGELTLLEGVDPPLEVLWLIHVVADERTDKAWLHTHGLWRCGRPELDLVGVRRRLVGAGGTLLNAIGERLLEEALPAPGLPFAVGPGMEVSFQPWREVAPLVGASPGGMEDRTPEAGTAHAGVRAVVCAAGPSAGGPEAMQAPATVMQRLDRGEAPLYIGCRESERRAQVAQASWPAIAGAFERAPRRLLRTDGRQPAPGDLPAVRFLVKSVMAPGSLDGLREHLWFVARRFDGERVEAELLDQPLEACGLNRGDVTWIDRHAISDLVVATPLGIFGPQDVVELERAIEGLGGGAP